MERSESAIADVTHSSGGVASGLPSSDSVSNGLLESSDVQTSPEDSGEVRTLVVRRELAPAGGHGVAPPSQADDDAHLVRLWLHGKSENTRDAYERDVRAFVDVVDRPLQMVTLGMLQDWADSLTQAGLAASSRARKLSAVKSLMTFGHRLGYLPFNVGAAVTPPRAKDTLSEKILPEAAVHRVLAVADHRAAETESFTDQRNALALRLFYATGGRVSELAGLRWRDCLEREQNGKTSGQLTLFGKGDKTRRVLLSPSTWAVVRGHRQRETSHGHAEADHPVLRSRKAGAGGEPRALTRQQLWRVVKTLGKRAGLPEAVSPHFFRHAHASHALDRGAPPHLVQQTLGHASLQTTSRYAHARPDESSATYLGV